MIEHQSKCDGSFSKTKESVDPFSHKHKLNNTVSFYDFDGPVRDLNQWPLRHQCNALPTELANPLGAVTVLASTREVMNQWLWMYESLIYVNCGLWNEYESDLRSNGHYLRVNVSKNQRIIKNRGHGQKIVSSHFLSTSSYRFYLKGSEVSLCKYLF